MLFLWWCLPPHTHLCFSPMVISLTCELSLVTCWTITCLHLRQAIANPCCQIILVIFFKLPTYFTIPYIQVVSNCSVRYY